MLVLVCGNRVVNSGTYQCKAVLRALGRKLHYGRQKHCWELVCVPLITYDMTQLDRDNHIMTLQPNLDPDSVQVGQLQTISLFEVVLHSCLGENEHRKARMDTYR
jgi:hypothetical protein